MKTLALTCILFLGLVLSNNSLGQTETGKTEILILGTQHLSQVEGFRPEMLEKVIAQLNAMTFDAVCIENMPGELLYDIKSRKDNAFVDVLERFGGERLKIAEQAQAHFNIDFPGAQNRIARILQKTDLTANDRKSLIEHYLASADVASAVLQFKYLQNNHETAGEDIFVVLSNDKLLKYSQSPDEIYSLAIPVALNRDLQKLEYIDNFQDEAILLKYFPEFIEDYMANQDQFKDVGNHPVFKKAEEIVRKGILDSDFLELFIFLNSKEYQEQDYEAQWKIWLETNFPSRSDLSRFSLWEMRNLQIAANIMRTAAFYPEKRILVIIGASHKLFLEKYLRMVPSIELLEFKKE